MALVGASRPLPTVFFLWLAGTAAHVRRKALAGLRCLSLPGCYVYGAAVAGQILLATEKLIVDEGVKHGGDAYVPFC